MDPLASFLPFLFDVHWVGYGEISGLPDLGRDINLLPTDWESDTALGGSIYLVW
jgi:hypothetical protein